VDSGQAQICTAFFTKHRVPSPGEYLEIIADNLNKAGWSWGRVSTLDRNGRKSSLLMLTATKGEEFDARMTGQARFAYH